MVGIAASMGVAAAGRLNVGSVYLTEWCPRKNQTAVHILNLTGMAIIILSYIIFYWLISNETQYVLVVGCIVCIITAILAFFVPESPRFLVAKGKATEVQKAFNRMAWFNRKEIEWTDQEIAWINENSHSKM